MDGTVEVPVAVGSKEEDDELEVRLEVTFVVFVEVEAG